MRHVSFLIVALLLTLNSNAQKTVRMDAVRANDYGIAYTLPKTALEIDIDYTKTTKTAGEFYMYAERYLNITNPIAEDNVLFSLDKLEARSIGVPDTKQSFLVEFRPNSAMAYVTLTEDRMLCAINDSYTFPTVSRVVKGNSEELGSTINAHQYFSEEILRAGSTAKQAELIAKQIYKIRESRNDILTGEADNMPPDGEAYKLVMAQLDEQEQALTALFKGKESKESMTRTIKIDIDDKAIDESIVARFSKKLGLVKSNDLSGEPIYLSLAPKNEKAVIVELTEKEMKEKEKKFERGIIYNIPAKATLKVEFGNKIYVNKECDVVQYGDQEVLDQKQFGDKNSPLKVIFYPELGAIKETGIAH